jgi:hypothetical protein
MRARLVRLGQILLLHLMVTYKIARDEDDIIANLSEIRIKNDNEISADLLPGVIEIQSISGGYAFITVTLKVNLGSLDPALNPKLRTRVAQPFGESASCQVLLDEITFPEKVCAPVAGGNIFWKVSGLYESSGINPNDSRVRW